MHKGQFSCYLDDVYPHLTEVTVEAWALDGKCRLAGSSVGAEGTQQNPWVLVDTELSEPEDAGQGRRARSSQRLAGQFVLWSTLMLQTDTGAIPRDV